MRYSDWEQRQMDAEYSLKMDRELEQRRREGKATKGGPTVTDPDRPYCKPDQSCCDFCCGN